jgi:hypothetical protein
MLVASDVHPSWERLIAFGLGKRVPDRDGDLEEHLLYCDVCCGGLDRVPADGFLDALRHARSGR